MMETFPQWSMTEYSLFGWWLVLVWCERKILLAGSQQNRVNGRKSTNLDRGKTRNSRMAEAPLHHRGRPRAPPLQPHVGVAGAVGVDRWQAPCLHHVHARACDGWIHAGDDRICARQGRRRPDPRILGPAATRSAQHGNSFPLSLSRAGSPVNLSKNGSMGTPPGATRRAPQ